MKFQNALKMLFEGKTVYSPKINREKDDMGNDEKFFLKFQDGQFIAMHKDKKNGTIYSEVAERIHEYAFLYDWHIVEKNR